MHSVVHAQGKPNTKTGRVQLLDWYERQRNSLKNDECKGRFPLAGRAGLPPAYAVLQYEGTGPSKTLKSFTVTGAGLVDMVLGGLKKVGTFPAPSGLEFTAIRDFISSVCRRVTGPVPRFLDKQTCEMHLRGLGHEVGKCDRKIEDDWRGATVSCAPDHTCCDLTQALR